MIIWGFVADSCTVKPGIVSFTRLLQRNLAPDIFSSADEDLARENSYPNRHPLRLIAVIWAGSLQITSSWKVSVTVYGYKKA